MSLPFDAKSSHSPETDRLASQSAAVTTLSAASPTASVASDVTESAEVTDSSSTPEITNWLHSPKKPSGLSRQVIWLMLIVSLGLHGILFWLPLPAEKPPIKAKPEEKSVRITQLPTLVKPVTVKPVAKVPPLKPAPAVQRPPSIRPPAPPTQRSVIQPLTPKPQAATQEAKSETAAANPWQDFPQYPQAESGCFNLPSCLRTGDGLDNVSRFFEQELAAKKYTFTPVKTEAERRVYRVSRNNLTQFLNVLTVAGQGTVYVLAPSELSLAELSKAKAVPPEIAAIFEGLDAEDVSRDRLLQPDAFYTADAPRSEIVDLRLIANPSPDITAETFFDAYLSTNLRNSNFDDYGETGQTYGGGPIYLAKKGKTLLYINTVPTQDGAGTVVVIWKSIPK